MPITNDNIRVEVFQPNEDIPLVRVSNGAFISILIGRKMDEANVNIFLHPDMKTGKDIMLIKAIKALADVLHKETGGKVTVWANKSKTDKNKI